MAPATSANTVGHQFTQHPRMVPASTSSRWRLEPVAPAASANTVGHQFTQHPRMVPASTSIRWRLEPVAPAASANTVGHQLTQHPSTVPASASEAHPLQQPCICHLAAWHGAGCWSVVSASGMRPLQLQHRPCAGDSLPAAPSPSPPSPSPAAASAGLGQIRA